MKVILERQKTEKNIEFNGTIKELLQKLELNPEEVITAKNNEIVTETTQVNNEDTVKIMPVISGG